MVCKIGARPSPEAAHPQDACAHSVGMRPNRGVRPLLQPEGVLARHDLQIDHITPQTQSALKRLFLCRASPFFRVHQSSRRR